MLLKNGMMTEGQTVDRSEYETRKLFKHHPPLRSPRGGTLRHASWMMENLPNDPIRKARWIGYAQAIAVVRGLISLDKLRS